jgi:bacterioferritin
MKEKNSLIGMLTKAYWMEVETVMNYLANAIDLDGVRAEEIKKSLLADVTEELTHAQGFARRVKELGGRIPGSAEFKASQKSLQPPGDSTDVVAVIRGVIERPRKAQLRITKTSLKRPVIRTITSHRTLASEHLPMRKPTGGSLPAT